MNRKLFTSGERITLVMIACAAGCILLSLLLGAFAALYYVPEFAVLMRKGGITLAQLRPMHTTFASAWIYLGAVTCVYAYLFHRFGEQLGVQLEANSRNVARLLGPKQVAGAADVEVVGRNLKSCPKFTEALENPQALCRLAGDPLPTG